MSAFEELYDMGYSVDEIAEVLSRDSSDFEDHELRPHTEDSLEGMLNWLEDAGISEYADVWYDWDDNEWHYVVNDSP